MCDADVQASAFREEWRRARKVHECCVCDDPIQVGELYHYCSGIWDGGAAAYKHCARCWKIYEEINAYVIKEFHELAALDLSCGVDYEPEDENDPRLWLAFLTREEGQRFAVRSAAQEKQGKEFWKLMAERGRQYRKRIEGSSP